MDNKKDDIESLKYLIANHNSMISDWEKNKRKEEAGMKKLLEEGNREVEKSRRRGYSEEQIARAIAVEITQVEVVCGEHIAECQRHIDELNRERQEFIKQLKELTGSENIGVSGKVTEFAAEDGGKQKLVGCLIWIVVIAVILKACGVI